MAEELRLTSAGEPGGELTVILVHSSAQDRRVWHNVMDLLPAATERPVHVLGLRPARARGTTLPSWSGE